VTVVLVCRDLLFGSRIAGAVSRAGHELLRLDGLAGLPPPSSVNLILVDWAERRPDWSTRLQAWCIDVRQSERPKLVLFGPHTDLTAHADARAAGLGPMWARSRLLAELPSLLAVD
jgi:hypothetical protein